MCFCNLMHKPIIQERREVLLAGTFWLIRSEPQILPFLRSTRGVVFTSQGQRVTSFIHQNFSQGAGVLHWLSLAHACVHIHHRASVFWAVTPLPCVGSVSAAALLSASWPCGKAFGQRSHSQVSKTENRAGVWSWRVSRNSKLFSIASLAGKSYIGEIVWNCLCYD